MKSYEVTINGNKWTVGATSRRVALNKAFGLWYSRAKSKDLVFQEQDFRVFVKRLE
jgi:hypothetical protein